MGHAVGVGGVNVSEAVDQNAADVVVQQPVGGVGEQTPPRRRRAGARRTIACQPPALQAHVDILHGFMHGDGRDVLRGQKVLPAAVHRVLTVLVQAVIGANPERRAFDRQGRHGKTAEGVGRCLRGRHGGHRSVLEAFADRGTVSRGGVGRGRLREIGEPFFAIEHLPALTVEAVKARRRAHPQAVDIVEHQRVDGLAREQQVVRDFQNDEFFFFRIGFDVVEGAHLGRQAVKVSRTAGVAADDVVDFLALLEHVLMMRAPAPSVEEGEAVAGPHPHGGTHQKAGARPRGDGRERARRLARTRCGQHQFPLVGDRPEGEAGRVPVRAVHVVRQGHGGLAHAKLTRAHRHHQGDDGAALGMNGRGRKKGRERGQHRGREENGSKRGARTGVDDGQKGLRGDVIT